MRRSWQPGAELDTTDFRVRRGSTKLDGLQSLGWVDALSMFRPFLSYAELGALLNKPSELHDKLKGILGLDDVTAAIKLLTDARKTRDQRKKSTEEGRKRLVERLKALEDDPRAQQCLAAVDTRAWDLPAVETIVLGDQDEDNDDAVRDLRQLAQLTGPSVDKVGTAVSELRAAIAAQAELLDTNAESNSQLAKLLTQALHHCGDTTESCPVCGGDLNDSWAAETQARLEQAKGLATTVRAANESLDRCHRQARGLIRPVPGVLNGVGDLDLPTDLLTAWQSWCDAPPDAAGLCEHAESKVLELVEPLAALATQARIKLEALQSVWRPLALELAAWLEPARAVQAEAAAFTALKKAETWLKKADESLRDDRFKPISAAAQAIWTTLRQRSNVDLIQVKLEGKATRRTVKLNVTVDGQEGVAMGVMSQGELNALALSLFLPRMTLDESPFRFLIIDDPVQAMDPHKVDGLARVLEEVAQSRQVIVLTHDDRLYEAVRRLGIKATAVGVQRRAQSVIELEGMLDPVERHFRDARTIVHSEQKIGQALTARLVPGFCRLGIEASCIEAIRRRRLGRGDPHVDVEQAIEAAKGLQTLATLAIFDDASRGGDVYSHLRNKLGGTSVNTFKAVKEGAHGGFAGSVDDLVHDSRKVADALRWIP